MVIKKNNKLIILLVLLLLFFLLPLAAGCFNQAENDQSVDKNQPVGQDKEDNRSNENLGINPLTGLEAPVDNLLRRPLAVMVENNPAARPQDGLAEADLVYEMLSEGAITRFMAIYYGSDADKIGPVRSARPYFIERSFDYNAIYAHSGGSEEAKANIKKYRVADLDEFANAQTYWRWKKRKAPHNLYTSTAKLWQRAKEKNYDPEVIVPAFQFLAKGEQQPGGNGATQVTIKYPIGFSVVVYDYLDSKGLYMRRMGGKPHVDMASGKQLGAQNIIIQYVDSRVIDGEGRRAIKMIGQGKGILITGGKEYKIEWKKSALRETTLYNYVDGGPIKLNPGQTWIQVVSPKTTVMVRSDVDGH